MTTTDPMISCSTKSFGAHDDHAETGIYVCKPEMNPARSSGWNVSFCGNIEAQTIHRRVRLLLTKMYPWHFRSFPAYINVQGLPVLWQGGFSDLWIFSCANSHASMLGFIGFIHMTGHGPFAGFTTTDPEYHQKAHGDGGMAGWTQGSHPF